MTIAFYIPTF